MTFLDATILGLLQGVTEFLPVSSSGHLALARDALDYAPPGGVLVEVLMHVGTALAIVVVFARDMVPLVAAGTKIFSPWSWRVAWETDEHFRLAALLVISAIPVAVVGLAFEDRVEALFDDTEFVGVMLVVTGCLLLMLHFMKPRGRAPVGLRATIVMGLAQAAAILPGISRSGSTITAGLLAGSSREAVGRFAFLMSLPPILGVAILKVGDAEVSNVDVGPLILGMAVAFASGVVALKLLLGFVARGRVALFAPYCLIVGVLALCR
ncbi:MAG: UDP-diphosphatase [Planctomycetes bacterium]|nr:UDP-diphosphatase [Planctomycetota bacterium]